MRRAPCRTTQCRKVHTLEYGMVRWGSPKTPPHSGVEGAFG